MINWDKIKWFSPDEFPGNEAGYIDDGAIHRYDTARQLTRTPWYPSPVTGGTARFEGNKTSRHYAVGRLSDALDFFPAKDTHHAWFLYQLFGSHLFGAIGLYLDTTGFAHSSDLMYHVDCRPKALGYPLIWWAEETDKGRTYTYVTNNKKLSQLMELLTKIR